MRRYFAGNRAYNRRPVRADVQRRECPGKTAAGHAASAFLFAAAGTVIRLGRSVIMIGCAVRCATAMQMTAGSAICGPHIGQAEGQHLTAQQRKGQQRERKKATQAHTR